MAKTSVSKLKQALAKGVQDELRYTSGGALRDEHTVEEFMSAILLDIKKVVAKMAYLDYRNNIMTSCNVNMRGWDADENRLEVFVKLYGGIGISYMATEGKHECTMTVQAKAYTGKLAGFKTLVKGCSAEDVRRLFASSG